MSRPLSRVLLNRDGECFCLGLGVGFWWGVIVAVLVEVTR